MRGAAGADGAALPLPLAGTRTLASRSVSQGPRVLSREERIMDPVPQGLWDEGVRPRRPLSDTHELAVCLSGCEDVHALLLPTSFPF